MVVKENLTPLIGAQAAQRMMLITFNEENLVTTLPPFSKEAEVKLLNAAEEVIKRFSDVFDRPFGTFPGKVYWKLNQTQFLLSYPRGKFQQHLKRNLNKNLPNLLMRR